MMPVDDTTQHRSTVLLAQPGSQAICVVFAMKRHELKCLPGECAMLLCVASLCTQGILPTRLYSENKVVASVNKIEYSRLQGTEV